LRVDSAIVEARSPGAAPAVFTANALVPSGFLVTKLNGDGQTTVAGDPFPGPLAVRVTTADNVPIQGLDVTWASSYDVLPDGTATFVAQRSDTTGVAVARWTPVVAGPVAANGTLRVFTPGGLVQRPLSFVARATGTAPYRIVADAADSMGITAGDSVAVRVRVVDARGYRVLEPVPVQWQVTSAQGRVTPATSTVSFQTGLATAWWWLGTQAGDAGTLSASIGGGSSGLAFKGLVMAGPFWGYEIFPKSLTLHVGEQAQVGIQPRDRYGNPTSNRLGLGIAAWSFRSNSTAVDVNFATGVVTALGVGTDVVFVTPGYGQPCTVTVVP
jgi:hypothetical protein